MSYDNFRLHLGRSPPKYALSEGIRFRKAQEAAHNYDLCANCAGDDGSLGNETAP